MSGSIVLIWIARFSNTVIANSIFIKLQNVIIIKLNYIYSSIWESYRFLYTFSKRKWTQIRRFRIII